jgi:hypothetical protein
MKVQRGAGSGLTGSLLVHRLKAPIVEIQGAGSLPSEFLLTTPWHLNPAHHSRRAGFFCRRNHRPTARVTFHLIGLGARTAVAAVAVAAAKASEVPMSVSELVTRTCGLANSIPFFSNVASTR